MLTPYSEADMSAVMALLKRYRDSFEQRLGIRLGMSFFVQASTNALNAYRSIKAEIDSDEIVSNITTASGARSAPRVRPRTRAGPAAVAA